MFSAFAQHVALVNSSGRRSCFSASGVNLLNPFRQIRFQIRVLGEESFPWGSQLTVKIILGGKHQPSPSGASPWRINNQLAFSKGTFTFHTRLNPIPQAASPGTPPPVLRPRAAAAGPATAKLSPRFVRQPSPSPAPNALGPRMQVRPGGRSGKQTPGSGCFLHGHGDEVVSRHVPRCASSFTGWTDNVC